MKSNLMSLHSFAKQCIFRTEVKRPLQKETLLVIEKLDVMLPHIRTANKVSNIALLSLISDMPQIDKNNVDLDQLIKNVKAVIKAHRELMILVTDIAMESEKIIN